MFYGKLTDASIYLPLLKHPVWAEVFAWLERLPANQPHGVYELRGREIYVNLHGYDTRPRPDCRYESHRSSLDIQYCISGGESIEWHPLVALTPSDAYDAKKDVIHHYQPAQPEAVLRMTPGTFAIFFPHDGHMPKLADGLHHHVEKLVVKIDLALLRP